VGRVLVESSVALQACRSFEELTLDDVGLIIKMILLLTKDTLYTVKHAVSRSSVSAEADAAICRLLVFGRLAAASASHRVEKQAQPTGLTLDVLNAT
jgi:hypothetical protein